MSPPALRDENEAPSERLLQALWQHQRLRRDRLETADGKIVRVLHPGFISLEGGPDFRGAMIQIGDDAARADDVEIDLRSAGWRAHGHDHNPNFTKGILHVVWDAAGVHAGAGHPLKAPDRLPPESRLCRQRCRSRTSSMRRRPSWAWRWQTNRRGALPENLRGKCSAPLRTIAEAQLLELLRAAAQVRLANKAGTMLARARNSNWEQALWEQNLAERKPRWGHGAHSAFALQARLLGVGGLPPDELARAQKSSDTFLRRPWDAWWRDRDEFADCLPPRSAWKFYGLRPANHPQRRLALASHWLVDENFIAKIEAWGASEMPDNKLLPSLHDIFQVERDEFWSWHWTFKSARLPGLERLLGAARLTDLAINVVLPWRWVRAREGGNQKFRSEEERRFFTWPATADNSVLKRARQRLLGSSNARILKTAAAQRGLRQIVRDFCEHSNAVCEHCRFPGLVRGWKIPI